MTLFPDELFADLFPSGRGRPSVPGDVMATALVLKELEGLSDRQAADALRCDIRWKVAAGLTLDHPGVHYTVFTYWRTRLAQSTRPDRIKEAVDGVVRAATTTPRQADLRLGRPQAKQDLVSGLVSDAHHRRGLRHLRGPLPGLPPAAALHHRQGGPQPEHQRMTPS